MKTWAPAVTVFAATAGRPIAVRGVALIAGLALPAGVLFGPQALPPAEVAQWFDHFPGVRALFIIAAAILAAPVLAPGLVAPGILFCRSLPVPRVQWISLTAVSALAVQAPVLILFGTAGALADAAALGCSAAAAALVLAAGVADASGIAAAVTSSIVVIAGVPHTMSVALAVAMLGLSARAAWARAPEAVARHRNPPQLVGGPPWYALAVVHGLRLARQGATTLVFWVPFAVGTGLLAAVVVRNRADVASTPPMFIVLLVATLPFVLVTGTTCQRVLDCERRLRWMLDATGTRRWERQAAAAITLSFVASVTAALVGTSVALTDRWSAPKTARCLFGCGAWAVGLGLLLFALIGIDEQHRFGRHPLRERPKDGARHTLGSAIFGGAALVLVLLLGEAAPYVVLAVAITVNLLTALDSAHEKRAYD